MFCCVVYQPNIFVTSCTHWQTTPPFLSSQDMAEDSLSIPAAITTILQTPEGRQYLDQLHPGDPNSPVSFDVQDSCLVCVAHQMKTVQSFLSKVQANMRHGKYKVRIIYIFESLKRKRRVHAVICVKFRRRWMTSVYRINLKWVHGTG